MVSIDLVVVNYKTYPLIQAFIDSYQKFRPSTPSNLVVVDNASIASDLNELKLYDAEAHGFQQNMGYARACNYGASLGSSKYIGIFNSDTEFVNNKCVDRCVQFMEDNPEVGVVGPLQYSSALPKKRRITHAGIFGPGDSPVHRGWQSIDDGEKYRDVQEALMVMGSVLFIRRSAWDTIANDSTFRKHWPDALGAMPEHFLYYEETALCYAMPKFGYKVFYVGDQGAEMVHAWHQSIKRMDENNIFQESRRMFRALMDDWGILHD